MKTWKKNGEDFVASKKLFKSPKLIQQEKPLLEFTLEQIQVHPECGPASVWWR